MGSIKRTAAALLFALTCLAGVTSALTWRETSYPDFSDGRLSDNLYVSRRDDGTIEFEWAFDLNNDGYCDLMCADWQGPYLRVYFGSSAGYSNNRIRLLPIVYGGGCDVADLDCDGHPDLVHSGWHDQATIFWGTDSGPNPGSSQQLDADGAETVTIDDLDGDGYIDLIFPGEDGTLAIYWGSSGGYSTSRRLRIPFGHGMSHNATISDLDQDGFRDIVLCLYEGSSQQPVMFFGPNRTYRIEWLDYIAGSGYGPHGTTVADFNRDGWLDLVYSGYNNVDRSYVYFGSDTGFNDSRLTIVTPGVCYGGSAACDFNGDGLLDIAYFRGDGNYGGYWKPIIYLNSGSAPYFSDVQTQLVGPDAVALSGGLAGDFNRDGNLDIYLDGYDPNGASHTPSMVLWGPDWMISDTLATRVDHHAMFREPGNLYDRSYRDDYVSSVFDGGATTNWHAVTWDDSTPGGSSVNVAVRAGATPTPDPTWSDWYPVANGDTVPDFLNSRYVQYRATLAYQNPASLPMLFEVRLDYGQPLTQDVGPTAILVPSGTVDSGAQVMPTVVVRNFGTTSAAFPTTITIGSGYSQTQSDTLAAGAADTVQFPDWDAGPVGTQPVVCFTSLTGDENPANDTIIGSVSVRRVLDLDVAPIKILSPSGTPESGKVYAPSVVIRNLGRTAVEFPVTMTLGVVYSETKQETLAAGTSDTVSFMPWTAEPVGPVVAMCYTALAGDQDAHNDTIGDTLTVLGPPEHDVGAIMILAPSGTVHAGDTVVPRGRIRNFGNRVERFFDVRFRIGETYSRTANEAQTLYPDSTVELAFPPWLASSGNWAVSCSTTLSADAYRANDKVASTVRAFEQRLHVEPDQSDRLETGVRKTYRFYAVIDGDTGGIVEVAQPATPSGWGVRLCDTTGANDLTDTDADGIPDLGYVAAEDTSRFSLDVMTPSGLTGDTALFGHRTFVIAAHMGRDSLIADTALLNLSLVPALSVHNFPNPFASHTTFVIGLPGDGKVSLTVYTRAGERVCRVLGQQDRTAGVHFVPWDAVNDKGRAVAPGTYEYVLDYVHQGTTDRVWKKLVVTRE